jgi:hypothetical protein
MISTRRLLALPSAEVLSATGRLSPRPSTWILSALTPAWRRKSATDCALARESSRLRLSVPRESVYPATMAKRSGEARSASATAPRRSCASGRSAARLEQHLSAEGDHRLGGPDAHVGQGSEPLDRGGLRGLRFDPGLRLGGERGLGRRELAALLRHRRVARREVVSTVLELLAAVAGHVLELRVVVVPLLPGPSLEQRPPRAGHRDPDLALCHIGVVRLQHGVVRLLLGECQVALRRQQLVALELLGRAVARRLHDAASCRELRRDAA